MNYLNYYLELRSVIGCTPFPKTKQANSQRYVPQIWISSPPPLIFLSVLYQAQKVGGVGINLSRKCSGSGSTIGGLPFVVAGPPSLCPFCILWHVLHSQGHCKPWWLRQVQNTQPGGPCRRMEGCALSPCPHFKPPGFTVQKVAKERSMASSSGLHHHTRTESSTISRVAQSANTFQISMRRQLLIPTPFLPRFSICTDPPRGMLRQLSPTHLSFGS